MTDPRLTSLRSLWAADIAAMKAGTYTAPLPHPSLVAVTLSEAISRGKKTAFKLRMKKGERNV